jgi:hypothetical protein
MNERRNVPEIVIAIPRIASQIPNSDQSPLYDVRNPARPSDKDATCEVMFRGRLLWLGSRAGLRCFELRRAHFDRLCPAAPRIAEGEAWWSQTGSNRRPHACKARALPAELWPRTRRRMLLRARLAGAMAQQPSFKRACRAEAAEQRGLVGLGRLELPTSRLSSARSNQLSYKPLTLIPKRKRELARAQPASRRMVSTSAAPGACSSAKKEKRRRRNPANGAQQS